MTRRAGAAGLMEQAMSGLTSHQAERSVTSARFETLLDKLVAVQMDLQPVCEEGRGGTRTVASCNTIADACDILHSAIADVRNIIHQVHGLTDLPEAVLHSAITVDRRRGPLSNAGTLLAGNIEPAHRRRR